MRRALTAGLLLVALAALGFAGISALRPKTPPLDDFGPVGDFSLTERDGRTITSADLAGKVWVASFVFTRCTGPCPQVTGTVARLQKQLGDEPDVRLVTFTVDPERDDPDELKRYADKFGADPRRWLFLTGPEKEIDRLLRDNFHVGVGREADKEVTHSTKLALVDRRGRVRAYFDGRQVDEQGAAVDDLPRLRQAVAALLREAP
jgi:cytochrome oxidase Cu insertion factor (SCO1/SenC/PrrC family)